MEANQLSTKQDLINLQQSLLKEITTLFKRNPSDQKEWLKGRDVRKMLSISSGTLQTLRINGTLPFTKMGGSIYYSYEDVIQVLNQNKRNTEK